MISPIVRQFGEVIVALYPGNTIAFEFNRFSEHRDSLTAELTVSNGAGHLHWSRINLASTTGRRDVIKALEEVHPVEGWRGMLDGACQAVALFRRTGEPAEELTAEPANDQQYLVTPWVPKGEITVLYGPGGTAKSLFSLATALGGLMGHTLGSPWSVGPLSKVLYLDWEADRTAHGQRIRKLLHGIEDLPPGRLYHRRLYRPFTDVVADVRTEAARLAVDFVVMDSLGAACGPEPETAGAALGTLQALRSLPGTKLVIAHESKAALDTAQGKPFGSIYVENTARSTIEIRPRESLEPSTLTVTLRHAKHNEGPKAAPTGVTFTFDPTSIRLERAKADPTSHSIARQVLDSLMSGRKEIPDIAALTGANEASVKTALRRLSLDGKVVQFESVKGGRGQRGMWGLKLSSDSGYGD